MPIKTVAVVGAGTMGAGIAQVCAQAGYQTQIVDADPHARELARQRILDFWAKGIERGKTTAAQRDAWSALLFLAPNLEQAASQSDLVIEAVPENMKLKQKLFGELDAVAPPHAILATNTSSLSVAAIAASTKRPERVLGLHFFNPVPLMQLLEIVQHDDLSRATLDTCRAFGSSLGKTSILVKDSPGFATSRLGIILGNEAMRMLEEGVASASDIDTAMRLGYGHPMGPLELSDLVGLDVRCMISEYLEGTLGPQFAPPTLAKRLVERGELGKKTGSGIYDWSSGKPKERAVK